MRAHLCYKDIDMIFKRIFIVKNPRSLKITKKEKKESKKRKREREKERKEGLREMIMKKVCNGAESDWKLRNKKM
jgi:hypothetical protein